MPSCSLIRLLQGMNSCSNGSSSSCSQSRLLQRLGCGGGKGRSCSQCLRLGCSQCPWCPTQNQSRSPCDLEGAQLRMEISHNLEGAQLGMAKVPNSESIYYSSFKDSNRHWNSSNVHFSPPREPHGTLGQKLHRSDNIILGQHLQPWEPYSWDLMGGKHARYGKIDEIQLGPLNFYHIAPLFLFKEPSIKHFQLKNHWIMLW